MIKQRVFGLDIMRAVAILFVVFSHALWIVPDSKGIIPDILSLAGVIGVEIFFVLSGFLIGRIVYKIFISDDFNLKKIKYFWVRRWFRTLPNYYLILIVNVFLALYLGTELPKNLWLYFFFMQNFAWEMPVFFTESWSLPIEEFAYIIGPLLLYFFLFFKLKISKSKLFGLVTFMLIVFFVITKIIYNFNASGSDMIFWNVNLKAVTLYRIDAIYIGVLAACFSMIKPKTWNKVSLLSFIIGAIIFLGLNYIITAKQVFIETHPFFWNVLYLPINSVAIAFCLPLLSNIKSAPKFILIPITTISIISYSMYLLHYSIVLQLLKYFLPSEGLSNFDVSIYIAVYVIITILLSYMLYYAFEKPMMDIRDKPYFRKVGK